jgi:hypothetical protein
MTPLKINTTKFKNTTILKILFFTFILFLIGGGLETIHTFTSGEQNAILIEDPKMSGLAPAAIALYGFGFLGLLLLYLSGVNMKKNSALAQKQFTSGFIIILIVFLFLTLLYGIGNDNWKI